MFNVFFYYSVATESGLQDLLETASWSLNDEYYKIITEQ